MMLDLDKIRQDTPACDSILHFNNAGASLMPRPVYKIMTDYLDLEQSIGGYAAAAQSTDAIENFYTAFATLLNAQPNEIAYVENATRAWNVAVYAIPFVAGDHVLIHDTEYSSNYLTLLRLSKTIGIDIEFVPSDAKGQMDLQALENKITPRTKAIFLTHAPAHGGLVNPAKAVGQICRKHNLIYVLDACQTVGQMRVDVDAIGCDILCGTGRKFLRGPRGTGVLYVSQRILTDLHPLFVDLQAAKWTSTHDYSLRTDARRFEGWERFMAGQIALGAAADYAVSIGMEAIEARIALLSSALRNQLESIEGVTLRDQGHKKSGIVSFEVKGLDAQDVVLRLRQNKINVSAARVEHARLDLEKRGVVSLVRASVHYYITNTEIERLCKAIADLH